MKKKYNILINITAILALALVLFGCKETTTTEDNTPKELTTEYTDNLTLTKDYVGKSFFVDRIGEATLNHCTDGDTASFTTGGKTISVRFLGINTPESTAVIQPWGKEASTFTCDKLENASKIVLEGDTEVIDSTGTRYLSWIWVDGRLLNLEIVEQAYSKIGAITNVTYKAIFEQAEAKTKVTNRRIWGEKDPAYDYTKTEYPVTIEELIKDPEAYVGKKLLVHGTVTRNIMNHAYLEDDGYAIFIFAGFIQTSKLNAGNEIKLSAYITDHEGSYQLTSINKFDIEVLSSGNVVEPYEITIPQLNASLEARLVKINDLTITGIGQISEVKSYSVYTKDDNNNQVIIRIDGRSYPYIEPTNFTVGTKIDVTGLVTKYNDTYQIALSLIEDINNK